MKNFLLGILIVLIGVLAYIGVKTNRQFTDLDNLNITIPSLTGDKRPVPTTDNNTDTPVGTDDTGSTVTGQTDSMSILGKIEGSFSYPSEMIPEDIYACAFNVATTEQYCTDVVIEDSKYVYGKGFIVAVPPGNYQVYIALKSTLNTNPEFRGWYSEAVACGLQVDCPKELLTLEVESGETISGINPADWQERSVQ